MLPHSLQVTMEQSCPWNKSTTKDRLRWRSGCCQATCPWSRTQGDAAVSLLSLSLSLSSSPTAALLLPLSLLFGAEDMKQVLPRFARPQAGLKGKDDNGGMLDW